MNRINNKSISIESNKIHWIKTYITEADIIYRLNKINELWDRVKKNIAFIQDKNEILCNINLNM